MLIYFLNGFKLQKNPLVYSFSFTQINKDQIASVFHPLRRSLALSAPIGIPDVIAARSGMWMFLQYYIFDYIIYMLQTLLHCIVLGLFR